METTKHEKLVLRSRNKATDDFGETPARWNRKKFSIGTIFSAATCSILASVETDSHVLKMAVVGNNRSQVFYDAGLMSDVTEDHFDSRAPLFKWRDQWMSDDVHDYVRHEARPCCRADALIVGLII